MIRCNIIVILVQACGKGVKIELYNIIPENLFSVLASKNKNLYVKALFVVLDAFKMHLKISKDELVSMISSKLDDEIMAADFSEEELLENAKYRTVLINDLVRNNVYEKLVDPSLKTRYTKLRKSAGCGY